MKKIKISTLALLTLFLIVMLFVTACNHDNVDKEKKNVEKTTCNHIWEDATCTAPKTCSVCKITEGDIGNHNYVDGICSFCGTEDPISTQIKMGETVYEKLNIANTLSEKKASSIYDAWYFAIYESDEDEYIDNVNRAIYDFSNSVGLDSDLVKESIDQYLKSLGMRVYDLSRLAVLGTNSGAISVVLYAYEKNGIDEIIETNLTEAKTLLKEMDSTYEKETNYSVLKEYYSDSKAFSDFVNSPTGSFSQFPTTLNGHTSKLIEHKNDLSFIYED